MIVYGIRMDMLTKYVSSLVYALLYLSHTLKSRVALDYTNDALSILYGPMCAVAICGLLINSFFHEEIQKRDKTSTLVRIGSDIFGHVLPFALVYYYGPTKSNISMTQYIALLLLFFTFFREHILRAYVGVPVPVLLGLAPVICISMFYLRFHS